MKKPAPAEVDLNRFRSFVKVMECGGYTRAAALLKVPKSKLSRHVADLEAELGTTLIVRNSRRFLPTSVGHHLFEKSRGILDGLLRALSEHREEEKVFAGKLRLATYEDIGILVLPRILADFRLAYPAVEFEVELTQDLKTLETGAFDCIVAIGRLPDSNLLRSMAGQVELLLVASPDFVAQHPLAQVKALEEAPVISFAKFKQKWELQSRGRSMEIRIRPRLRSNNPMMMLEYVLLGQGVSLLPRFLCAEALRQGRLVQLFPEWTRTTEPLQILSPRQGGTRLQMRFKDFLLNRLKMEFHPG